MPKRGLEAARKSVGPGGMERADKMVQSATKRAGRSVANAAAKVADAVTSPSEWVRPWVKRAASRAAGNKNTRNPGGFAKDMKPRSARDPEYRMKKRRLIRKAARGGGR